MRTIISLLALLTLAACGSGGVNPIVKDSFSRIPLFKGEEEEAKSPPRRITRAMIDQAGVAAIRAGVIDEDLRSTLFATSANDGYNTFANRIQQSITLRGALVTGTRGLGFDLLSVRASANDPLVRPTRPANWPASVERIYEFPAQGPQGKMVRMTCRFEPGKVQTMVILERSHTGLLITEYCTDERGVTVENLHLVDQSNGAIWRSLQWVSPDLANLDVQVIEPYTGD